MNEREQSEKLMAADILNEVNARIAEEEASQTGVSDFSSPFRYFHHKYN